MTDSQNHTDTDPDEPIIEELATADPADAPQIAEALADRLAGELDGTAASRTTGQGEPS